jgi:hypothetical protein
MSCHSSCTSTLTKSARVQHIVDAAQLGAEQLAHVVEPVGHADRVLQVGPTAKVGATVRHAAPFDRGEGHAALLVRDLFRVSNAANWRPCSTYTADREHVRNPYSVQPVLI